MAEIAIGTRIDTRSDAQGLSVMRNFRPLNLMVIGDFSGRESRAAVDLDSLKQRKTLRIDKDSFEQVFCKLEIELNLAEADQPLRLNDFDQLHPDYLYQSLEIFARYRQLLRQLSSQTHYEDAVKALTDQGLAAPKEAAVQTPAINRTEGGLLDDMLAGNSSQTGVFDVAALIREAVAPYVQPARDPDALHYMNAVELAVTDIMRKILHCEPFRSLEARWRSLDLLNRRADTDRELSIKLLDVSPSELRLDWQDSGRALAKTKLGDRLLSDLQVAGAAKIDYFLWDAVVTNDDLPMVEYLAHLAKSAGARLLIGTDIQQLDVQCPAGEVFLNTEYWQEFSNTSVAEHINLVSPGFLLRQPFGKRSSPIEGFHFEELSEPAQCDQYLWGNSAYLMVLAELQSRSRAERAGKYDGTWARLEDMPMFVYRDADGDECVVPGAGVFLTATRIKQLEQSGVTVVQSVKNSDHLLIERVLPLSSNSIR